MNMVEKEKNMIDYAHKILAFKMNVAKSCKAKGIVPPTDEQLSDYINGYGLCVADCVADYIEHEGMFRCLKTPLEEFKDEVTKIYFCTKPSDDELASFFSVHGNNVSLFCQQRTIKGMKPLVRKTYFKTIEKLSVKHLTKLWNKFIEESALYGEDSYIYDLSDLEDSKFLSEHMDGIQLKAISDMVTKNDTCYIQWFALNDGSIKAKTDEDIKSTITAYWEEIFERIMLYPSCYNFDVEIYCKGDASTYFDDVFFPIIAKEVGYLIDGNKGTIKEIEK